MPVDFALLPPTQPVPDEPPSRLVWTMVFFVVTTAGIFAVLLLWPKGEPTQTPWFWTCLTVYPLGIATFVVLRRYSVYEGRRLDAIAWNEAREQHVNEVFDRASRPLSALAVSCRFSSDTVDNEIEGVISGSIKLEARVVPAPDSPPVKARWFSHPDSDERGTRHTKDRDRQRDLVTQTFRVLLDDVADVVRGLPDDVNLSVQLSLAGSAIPEDALETWQVMWAERKLRPTRTRVDAESHDLMWLDSWLDRTNERRDQEARLLVFVQAQPVLEQSPPTGSAEAAIAILLAPASLNETLKCTRIAEIHRPMHATQTSIDDALAYALKWGVALPTDVKHIWQNGLEVDAAGAATKAWVKAGIGAKAINLDQVVGHDGKAVPWLALACALKAVVVERAAQLVVTESIDGPQFCVVRATVPASEKQGRNGLAPAVGR
jgi:hypothetical protein